MVTAIYHAQAALPTMPPLHRSHTDGPRRHNLPNRASFKSKGSILSHVTSGTWEDDADIENPHDAEEARKSPRVRSAAKSTHLPSTMCLLSSWPSVIGTGKASNIWLESRVQNSCTGACSSVQVLRMHPAVIKPTKQAAS